MKPHDYQRENINQIFEKFEDNYRVCYQLGTGGGKTVVFSFLSKEFIQKTGKKVLILCHREELVDQACETLLKLGLTYEKISPKTRRLHHNGDVYVAMIETLDRRLRKDSNYLRNVGLVIADESHVQVFQKVYDYFEGAKILGVTATPVLLGRDTFWRCERCNTEHKEVTTCCGFEAMEWSRPKRMADTYETIVVGPSVEFLIEFGQLVKEINFVEQSASLDDLEVDASGDFSSKSQNKAFGSSEAVFNVLLNYENIAKGKRTIVYNNSTETNLKVYKQFRDAGYNVKLYDSVNVTEESRRDIVRWFRDEPDAILMNCGVFVAGLDVREIEAVMANVATMSLSKFLQLAGRGGRSTDAIYKPHFLLIDGGGNVVRFGEWSSDRDWHDIFHNGIGKEKAKKESATNVAECEECGFLYPRHAGTCPECGNVVQPREKKEVELESGDTILVAIDAIPLPSGEKIKRYTLSQNENIHFAFKIMNSQILDLFRFNYVSRAQYINNKEDGRLDERLGQIIRPVYFELIKAEEFSADSNRTLKYVTDRVIKMLDKHYNV